MQNDRRDGGGISIACAKPQWMVGRVCLTVLLLAAAAAPAAAAEDLLSPEERAFIEAHGPIRHAPDPSYPPFEFYDASGNLTGINADLLNRISRNLGVEFETHRAANWSEALRAMRDREIDLLGALAVTPERETYMDFTGPYAQLGEVFYVTDRDPDARDVSDLVGKRVGVVRDYAAATWLRENHPELTIVETSDTLDGLNKLSRGELDAFFENVPVAGYYIRSTSLLNIRILGDPLYYSPVQWAVPEDEAMLLAIMEKGLASIDPGERARVFDYWTGSDLALPAPAGPAEIGPLARNLLIGAVVLGSLAVLWGISLRRTVHRRTAELAELNRDLERRVEKRTAELARANKDLEAFSFTVSHDLRTPLTSIKSYTELLDQKHGAKLDDDGRKYLARTRAGAQRMAQLIEDVLRFSRASQIAMETSDVDVSTAAAEVVAGLRETDPARKVAVRIQPGMKARGDPRLIRIVLENLVGNAWKYTRKNPEAHIEVGVGDDRSFYVRDDGAGFDPAEKHRLFQPFQRLHDPGEYDGTGIGLYTVERIVDRHGGRVGAESRPGHGATFRFWLGSP